VRPFHGSAAEEVEMRVSSTTKQSIIAKALRAAKNAGLEVCEFRVDPQSGVVVVTTLKSAEVAR
jgi:hypothetical protein